MALSNQESCFIDSSKTPEQVSELLKSINIPEKFCEVFVGKYNQYSMILYIYFPHC